MKQKFMLKFNGLPNHDRAYLHLKSQAGASLIEVLISIFILAFGMLALGVMSSFAVQMPKLSGYRAIAANLAASYIERIRANPGRPLEAPPILGFSSGLYDKESNYDATFIDIDLQKCAYPKCTEKSLADMDIAAIQQAVRRALPAGGIFMQRDSSSGTASTTEGNLWIIWQEPSIYASFNPASSGVDSPFADNCPLEVTKNYPKSKPRCLYVRFRI